MTIAEDLRIRGLTQNECNSQKTEEPIETPIKRAPAVLPPCGNGSRKREHSPSEDDIETRVRSPYNQMNNRDMVGEPPQRKSSHSSPFRQGMTV